MVAWLRSLRVTAVVLGSMAFVAVGGAWYCHWTLAELAARHAALVPLGMSPCGFGYIGPTIFARLFSVLACVSVGFVPALLGPTRSRFRSALLLTAVGFGCAGLTGGWPPMRLDLNASYVGLSLLAACAVRATRPAC